MKQTITLEIAGAKYRMTTDSEETHLRELAAIVNERIEALGPKALRSASQAQLLAVVALGLAEDLKSAEQRRAKLAAMTQRAVQGAIDRIDRRLADDARIEKETEEA